MEDIQPARQLKILNALLFFAQIGGNFIGNPGGELLLMTDGEATAVGDLLGRLVHHVRGDPPVEGDQHGGRDNGGPHRIAEDIEGDRDQPRLLKHDVTSQHNGADTGYAPEQDVNNI